MIKSKSRVKIEELEGLRGIAACTVLVTHIAQCWGQHISPSSSIISLLGFGTTSVMVFFFLSGFVIGHATPKEFSHQNCWAYLLRRAIRLCPIFWIALFLSFFLAGTSVFSKAFILHCLFLHCLVTPVIQNNGPLWSLHFEVAFYLMFLILWKWSILLKYAIYVGLAATALTVFIDTIPLQVLSLFIFWCCGLLVARTADELKSVVKNTGLPRPQFWTALFVISANFSILPFQAIIHRSGFPGSWAIAFVLHLPLFAQLFLAPVNLQVLSKYVAPCYVLSVATTFMGLGYAVTKPALFHEQGGYYVSILFLVLAAFSWSKKLPNPNTAFWRRCAPLGSISFALYVVHQPIIDWTVSRLAPTNSPFTVSVAIALAAIVAFALAWILELHLQPLIGCLSKQVLGSHLIYSDLAAVEQNGQATSNAKILL